MSWVVGTHTFNFCTQDAEAGRSLNPRPVRSIDIKGYTEKACIKQKQATNQKLDQTKSKQTTKKAIHNIRFQNPVNKNNHFLILKLSLQL